MLNDNELFRLRNPYHPNPETRKVILTLLQLIAGLIVSFAVFYGIFAAFYGFAGVKLWPVFLVWLVFIISQIDITEGKPTYEPLVSYLFKKLVSRILGR